MTLFLIICLVGIPVLLVCFIIWGICSIPEGEYEDYDSSGTDGDISANEDEPENIPGWLRIVTYSNLTISFDKSNYTLLKIVLRI